MARERQEENVHRRPGFWPLQRTPLSPQRSLARLFQNVEVTAGPGGIFLEIWPIEKAHGLTSPPCGV